MEAGSPITSRMMLALLGSSCVGVAVLHFALPTVTELADEPLLEVADLAIAAVALLAWLLLAGRVRVPRLRERPALIAACGFALAPIVLAAFALPTRVSNDERAYLLQAEMFATGRLTLPLVEPAELLRRRQIHEDASRGVIYSKYPPGTALALAPGTLLGRPEWMVAVAGVAAVLLCAGIARRLGIAGPGAAAFVFALCPGFLLLQTSLQSQVFTIPIALAGYAALLRARADPTRAFAWGCALGASAGWLLLSRPLTGVVFAAAMLPGLLVAGPSRRGREAGAPDEGVPAGRESTRRAPGGRAVLGAVACGLPFAVALLLYGRALTGDFWLTPYGAYAAERSPWDLYPLFRSAGVEAPLLASAQALSRQLVRWLPALFGVLGAAGLGFFGLWRLRARDGGAGFAFASLLPLAYALHWYPGHWAYLGPIYAAESLALLVLGALVIVEAAPEGWGRALPLIAAAAGLALFVERFAAIDMQVSKRHAPEVAARVAGLPTGAIVLLPHFSDPERQEDSENRYTPSRPPFESELVFLRELDSPARTRAALEAHGLGERPLWRFVPDSDVDGASGRLESYGR